MKTRREFLGNFGLASAGIAIGLSACKESYKPLLIAANDKINVGLVGCSQRGVDAVTGASYKLIKKLPDRVLRSKEKNVVYKYYNQFVSGYILDTLMGYKKLAESIIKTGSCPHTIKPAKYNSIAIHLANKAMHEGGVHYWKPEYGV